MTQCSMQADSGCTRRKISGGIRADGLIAGLQKLQLLEVQGSWSHSVAEERPGLLNRVLEGLTSLHLRAFALRCSDVASPDLRCLTLILSRDGDELGRLQGAHSSILTGQFQRSLMPLA